MIKKQSIIDIISPATPCNSLQLDLIKNFLNSISLDFNIFYEAETAVKEDDIYQDSEFASCDARYRFLQLKEALESPISKFIWCSRGGYGSADLLPMLFNISKPKYPKILIGFSDITSLNIFFNQNWQMPVISAPMLLQIASKKISQSAIDFLINFLQGKIDELVFSLKPVISESSNYNKEEKISGLLVGGCLSVLLSHCGTSNELDWHQKILFLEDEGESGERLERYFNQILRIIIEKKRVPKAIILGNFHESSIYGNVKSNNVELAIKIFANKIKQNNLDIALFIEPEKILGHSPNSMPLILGWQAEINNYKIKQKSLIFNN